MLILRIEKKNLYISTRHVEKCSGFILITMAFNNFSRCSTKYGVVHGLKEFYIHTHKNKVMLFLKIERNNDLYGLVTSRIPRVLY
jgi:hypothetical protein